MARAGMWTVGMAFAPVGFGVGVVVATGILNEVAARSVATDIAGNWMVVMVFGAVLFLPGIVFVRGSSAQTPERARLRLDMAV
ncbi:hypothetical protein [Nocardia otitidiscaviarum]|uniref:hypothetical protein n=1 Tax=Nocardia otitidiscaviarum TaxID=1823 RepID=UPI001893DB8A|nr:hypothetical protein [Nocardia otitidiscaviarum]MBF6179108.1 hypothetical protein [Nocardia otitidiscaviarum]